MQFAQEHDLESFVNEEEVRERARLLEKRITHVLDVEIYYDVKWAATSCHRTQFGPEHLFRQMPEELKRLFHGREHFIQVKPALAPQSQPIGDLLQGLAE